MDGSAMDDSPDSPLDMSHHTPYLPLVNDPTFSYTNPSGQSASTPHPLPKLPILPTDLTQALVNADPDLKRLQQDLLILTSFNENDTLHWRPSWFLQDHYAASFWTLYNPPDVVTELLPHAKLGRLVYTRRMRIPSDPAPMYIKTWEHWNRVCDLRGVPKDYLCEKHIKLLRLGLPRNARGELIAAPSYPLYPEPQPLGHGRYILSPDVYESHLPRKFHSLPTPSSPALEDSFVVVVHSSGRLAIEPRGEFFMHESQWTYYDGTGGYRADVKYVPDLGAPKDQSGSRRWSWVPWTREMEDSCRLVVVLKVRVPERKEPVVKLKLRNPEKR